MQLTDFFQFHAPTKIVYGPGLARDLEAELNDLKARRIFVITDSHVQQMDFYQATIDGINRTGARVVGVFSDVPANSGLKTVKQGSALGAELKADSILAIGGGSVIDTAKGVNAEMSLAGDLMTDFCGTHTMPHPLNPLIVIPTTAGTGSEVTLVAVIMNEEEKTKMAFVDRYLVPNLAVLDPEVTLSMPPYLTASTGMDAMAHAVEAYLGVDASPYSDALALQAMVMIRDNIVRACQDGQNIKARGNMLVAGNLAGVAFSHSMVGVGHGMAHSCGGLCGVPHGVANHILLPYAMRYNLDACEDRLGVLARLFFIKGTGLTGRELAEKAIDAIFELQRELAGVAGMPVRLSQVGVKEEDLPDIATATLSDGTCIYNPREVVFEEVLQSLKEAF
ncbi:MAG: iron-containing alcohol dehydrogenase [Deltaproteobacteria bacterium]|nr:iron-containing alcohol dehydrogenase [Deltaproteobacteria bacterium]MBF0525457.1 iron-containing alcohol dehydrogenase [Deltaproteobacteria bacterium]